MVREKAMIAACVVVTLYRLHISSECTGPELPATSGLTAGGICSYFVLMAGPIRDLGMASRFGMIIRAECRCGRFREFHASELVLRLGASRDPYRLRFKCRACAPLAKIVVREAPKPERKPTQATRPTQRPVVTIAEHIAGGYSLHAYCERYGARTCGHHGELDLAALGIRIGFDHSCLHDDLAPKLRCSACGSRKVSIRIAPFTNAPR